LQLAHLKKSSHQKVLIELFSPCSLGLSVTSQQYFSLRTNQLLATSQQYFSLRTNQHQPSATSQTNRLFVGPSLVAKLVACMFELKGKIAHY
jgi:hypothetical protein